jgi:hypothetical protein
MYHLAVFYSALKIDLMSEKTGKKIFDIPQFRNCVQVFRDREAAGKVLAGMLEQL